MSGQALPKPPADLDAESKQLWQLTLRQLEEQGTWFDSDAATLERYVRALERARVARRELTALTSTGSTGQLVQHPNVRTVREAELDAHRYATDLLLTPASRLRADLAARRRGVPSPFDALDAFSTFTPEAAARGR